MSENEAGKTAIVQALAGLNPHRSTPIVFDKERDYPRRFLTEYATRHEGKEAVVITISWALDDKERQQIAEIVRESAITGSNVTISREYGADAPAWSLPVDSKKASNFLSKMKS